MKDQLERKNGAAVLEELVRQLKQRERLGEMLNDLAAQDQQKLVSQLVEEMERAISWRHLQHQLVVRTPAAPPPAAVQMKPLAPIEISIAPPAPPADPPEQVKLSEPTMMPSEDGKSDADDEGDTAVRKQVPRVPSELEADDFVYLHGACRIDPEDSPSAVPFLLEEKGIDNRDFAFAFDYKGIRFYGSKLSRESTNLTKDGVLLLNKHENIRMRGSHESIVNELRLHGILLPFEFGTVFTGPAEMKEAVGSHLAEISSSLDELLKTRWWNLCVSALDSRTAELVGQSGPGARRESDRGRVPYTSPSQMKRIDVKTLERILGKQKRAAESVHESLQPFAERSDIDMMVSLQSGSSDDWKIILKASYELGPTMIMPFVRTVTDLQYQHFLMELMLSLTGNVENYSFAKNSNQ